MTKTFSIILACLLWLSCLPSDAVGMGYESEKLSGSYNATSIMLLSEQKVGVHSADDIVTVPKASWQQLEINHGKFTLPADVSWLKLTISNDHNIIRSIYFTLSNNFQIENVKFYTQLNNLKLIPVKERLTKTNVYYGNKHLIPFSKHTLYIRIKTDATLTNSIQIMAQEYFENFITEREFDHGFAVGGMLFLSLIFGIMFSATGEKLIGILASYFVLRCVFLAVFLGENLFYFYGQNADIRGFELPIMSAISSYFYLWFISTLFQLKGHFPKLYRLTLIVRWSILAYIPVGFALTVELNMMLTTLLMTGVMLYLLVLGVYLSSQKRPLAYLFSIVMLLQLLCTFAIALGSFFQVEMFSEREPIQIFSFWLNALLVISVISRLYFYQLKEKQKAQRAALEHAVASQEAQENLIKLQNESQEELEQRVQERTLELNIALNELEAANSELEQKNTIDVLTNLYNRRFYDQKVMAEYRRSKRNLTKLSLILIDIDHFKKVNDHYGHLAGDQCLFWVAQLIKGSIKRSTDIACRYGGEEFVLVLPDTEQAGAYALAETIREAIYTGEFTYQQQHIPLTISCGVSTYSQQQDALVEDLFLAADKALFQAKNGGRNQVKYKEIFAEQLIQESI